MMDTKFGESTLRNLLELPGVVGDITPTLFTKTKGIWQVENTKIQVVDAMHHVSEVLLKIRDQIPENQHNLFTAFPYPCILNTYAVPTHYVKELVNMVDIVEDGTNYNKPPSAWSNGPPHNLANNNKKNKQGNNTPIATNEKMYNQNKEVQRLSKELSDL
jgi:hypothetical protein